MDTELVALQIGLKKVARKVVKENELDKYNTLIKQFNLTSTHNNETNYLYISKDRQSAELANQYETELSKPLNYTKENFVAKIEEYFKAQEELQNKLGELFGYPKCCIAEFIRFNKSEFLKVHTAYNDNNEKQETIPNYAINTYNNTQNKEQFNFLLNNLCKRHLISHFPCSYECKESIRYAKKIFANLNQEQKIETIKNLRKSLLVINEEDFVNIDSKTLSQNTEIMKNFYFK